MRLCPARAVGLDAIGAFLPHENPLRKGDRYQQTRGQVDTLQIKFCWQRLRNQTPAKIGYAGYRAREL